MSQSELTQALLAKAIERARVDFKSFVYLFAPLVLPDGFVSGKHIDQIADKIGQIGHRDDLRFMVELPPGSMKSVLCSVLFPAWIFGIRPNSQVLQVSHSIDLATKFGRKLRDLIDTAEYKAVFPGTVMKDTSYSASRWDTTAGGGYYAAGADRQVAGFRGNVIIADDLIAEQTARSDVEREKIIQNWHSGIMSRALPKACVVYVGTRWHVMDVAGYILKQANEIEGADQWERLRYTALADKETAEKVGVEEGTSYWPEFWTTEFFKAKQAVMPLVDFQALYQQQPITPGGNIIRGYWIMDWKDKKPPPIQYCLISVDPAYSTKSTADYTAVLIFGLFQKEWQDSLGRSQFVNQMILLGGKKERMEFPDLCNYLKDLNRRRKPDTFLVEKKASGESIIQELRRQGLPITAWTPDRDKISRMWSIQPVVEANRVWFKKDMKFAQDVLTELEAFPNVEHDDISDAFSQAVMWMRRSRLEIVDPTEDAPARKRPIASYWSSLAKRRL